MGLWPVHIQIMVNRGPSDRYSESDQIPFLPSKIGGMLGRLAIRTLSNQGVLEVKWR